MKKGWKKVPFEACLKKVPKQKQIKAKDYSTCGLYPVVSQEAEMISGYHDDSALVYHHNKPVVIFGDHTKNIKYVDFDFIVGADGTHILMPIEEIDSKFFYYCLSSIELRNLGYARHYKLLKEKEIPLPPLSEQQRIVDYLDKTFAEIDTLKAKAAEEVANAKAMFDAALREEMTPKEGWEEKTLGELSCDVRYGTSSPSCSNGDYIYLRMNNISSDGRLILKDTKTISLKESEIEKCLVKKGDILFNRTNSLEHVGKTCVFDNDTPMIIAGYIIRIRLKKDVIVPHFLSYFFNTKSTKAYLRKIAVGAVHQANISAKSVQTVHVFFPRSLEEQRAIVSRLDSLRTLLTELEQKYAKIAAECDALKQAILRETFE